MRRFVSPKLIGSVVIGSLFLVILLVFAASPIANAQTNSDSKGSGEALEIGPPVLNLSANPGEVINTKINLRDISSGNLVVHGQVNDFTASGEDGTPKILLEEGASTPYSFKSWLAPLPSFTLKPREIKTLPITISVPKDASPGGYYGVIRFTANPPELDGTGVSLSASLGSLVLLKVNGVAKEELSLVSFTASANNKSGRIFENIPIKFSERIKNSGNIFEQPTGLVTITDVFGKKVATLPINQPPGNILPQSIRKFDEKLDKSVLGNKRLFGRYHAELKVNYGSNKQVLTSSLYFWVIPYKLISIIIVLLIIAFFVIRKLIKRYNQHIIAQAKKSSSKK